MDFYEQVDLIKSKLPAILKDVGQNVIIDFQGYLGAEMGLNKVSDSFLNGGDEAFPDKETTWSKDNELKIKSGRLIRSFSPKDDDSLSEIKVDKNGLTVYIGTKLPYAQIHEYGGFIEATPYSGTGRSKYNMEAYFWVKYYQTKNDFFRRMGLAVRKNGGVNIKKRPYFKPASEKYIKTGLAVTLAEIITRIQKLT